METTALSCQKRKEVLYFFVIVSSMTGTRVDVGRRISRLKDARQRQKGDGCFWNSDVNTKGSKSHFGKSKKPCVSLIIQVSISRLTIDYSFQGGFLRISLGKSC